MDTPTSLCRELIADTAIFVKIPHLLRACKCALQCDNETLKSDVATAIDKILSELYEAGYGKP